MIHVQLYKFGRLYRETKADTAKDADRSIDLLITEILHGKHGTGEFEIDADHVSDIGGSMGRHFASGQFFYPTPKRVAKPA
jgi:hypothetical protein